MNALYKERFLRSIGIMNEEGLGRIQATRVAVAGLGLGGSVFINLVRMGFENFKAADPDIFERTNANRQRGAKETTIGCRKDDCLVQEARSINPDVKVQLFREGVTEQNVSGFLEGVHWAIDAIDVFAMPEKLAFHAECRKRRIPVVSCVSVGFGASIVVFTPDTPSFAELSGLTKEQSYEVNIDRFIRFMMPEVPGYMAEQVRKAMNRSSHIPFVVPGVEISAALVTTEVSKHILGLGSPVVAPHGLYIDPVSFRFERFEASYLRSFRLVA